MALVSFRIFCKNLGHLREFFGQMVYRPPWQKISRTPMYIRFTPWSFLSIHAEEELQVGCLERMASFECGEESVCPSYWPWFYMYLDDML